MQAVCSAQPDAPLPPQHLASMKGAAGPGAQGGAGLGEAGVGGVTAATRHDSDGTVAARSGEGEPRGRGIALISAARPGRFHFHRAKLTWTWGRRWGGRQRARGRSGVADRQGNLAEREEESMWLLKPRHNNNIKKIKP